MFNKLHLVGNAFCQMKHTNAAAENMVGYFPRIYSDITNTCGRTMSSMTGVFIGFQ